VALVVESLPASAVVDEDGSTAPVAIVVVVPPIDPKDGGVGDPPELWPGWVVVVADGRVVVVDGGGAGGATLGLASSPKAQPSTLPGVGTRLPAPDEL
jgi:hypothetical protein